MPQGETALLALLVHFFFDLDPAIEEGRARTFACLLLAHHLVNVEDLLLFHVVLGTKTACARIADAVEILAVLRFFGL